MTAWVILIREKLRGAGAMATYSAAAGAARGDRKVTRWRFTVSLR